MAQPTHIDLQTGPDRFYRIIVWALWLTAALVTITQAHNQAWPLNAAAVSLLIVLWPGTKRRIQRSCRLRLYRDGAATLGEQTGRWGRYSRYSRWCVLLVIDLPQRGERVLVSARRNDAGDYRRLLVWTRFPPFTAFPVKQPWQWS